MFSKFVSKYFKAAFFLFKKNRSKTQTSQTLMLICMSLGVASLVALLNFSRRIEKTINTDARKTLAADFQIKSRRSFDDPLIKYVSKIAGGSENVNYRKGIITSVRDKSSLVSVVIRAVEDSYPFYGEFITEPQIDRSLWQDKALIYISKALQARGFKVGDPIQLGKVEFKIAGVILEEPDDLASAFSVGPRLYIHNSWIDKTGLTGKGSRVFHTLHIKTPLDEKTFTKKFQAKYPDPHFRIKSPEKATDQNQKAIERLNAFFSLIALCSLILGGAGVFSLFRSELLRRLKQELSLRALGFQKRTILTAYLMQALEFAFKGALIGYFVGFSAEYIFAEWIKHYFEISLQSTSFGHSFLYALLLTSFTTILAIYIPLNSVLSLPVNMALQDSIQPKFNINWKHSLAYILAALIFILAALSFQVKLSAYFSAALFALFIILVGFGFVFLKGAQKLFKNVFSINTLLTRIKRQWSSHLIFYFTLGTSIFIVLTTVHIGNNIRSQLDKGWEQGFPNVFLIGVEDDQTSELKKIRDDFKFIPIIQSRMSHINKEKITEEYAKKKLYFKDKDYREFLLRREYTLTFRDKINDSEEIIEGDKMFNSKPYENNVVRSSIEESLAKQLNLKLGDTFTLNIAGVPITAKIDSIRRVHWYNFRPNFYIVLKLEDTLGAPFSYVAFASVDTTKILGLQTKIQSELPNINVIDGETIKAKFKTLLDRISMAIFSLSFVSIICSLFALIALIIAKKQEKDQEIALYKCVGATKKQITRWMSFEFFTLSLGTVFIAEVFSSLSVFALSRGPLNIPYSPANYVVLIILLIGIPLFMTLTALWLYRPLFKSSPFSLLKYDN